MRNSSADDVFRHAFELTGPELRQLDKAAAHCNMRIGDYIRCALGMGTLTVTIDGIHVEDAPASAGNPPRHRPLDEIVNHVNAIIKTEQHKLPGTALIYIKELGQQRDALHAQLVAAQADLNVLRAATESS